MPSRILLIEPMYEFRVYDFRRIRFPTDRHLSNSIPLRQNRRDVAAGLSRLTLLKTRSFRIVPGREAIFYSSRFPSLEESRRACL